MVEWFHPDHQPPQVLYKYTPHPYFLKNSLFLFSPPGINDPKEAVPETIFRQYPPEDYAVARAQAEQNGFYNLSDEELEEGFMDPYPAHRYDETNLPALWRASVRERRLRAEPFHTIEEFDRAVAEHALTLCRQEIVRTLGIFSMTESTDETMWAYYAANHTGIRVAFGTRHPFFSQKEPPFPVEYTDTPIYISSCSGRVRIAGHLMSMEMIMRGEIPGFPPQLLIRKRLVVRRRQLVPAPGLGEPDGHRRGLLAGGYLPSASDH
jgi:hypothetical protein